MTFNQSFSDLVWKIQSQRLWLKVALFVYYFLVFFLLDLTNHGLLEYTNGKVIQIDYTEKSNQKMNSMAYSFWPMA